MSPFSEAGRSKDFPALFVSSSGPQRRRSTFSPVVPVSAPTSTSRWALNAYERGKRLLPAPAIAMLLRSSGAPGVRTESVGAKTWVFETAATVIASGADPGEPTEPMPNWSRSFPAEMTDTTPAAVTFRMTSIIASFAGSVSAPPPEKLMTSMPSRTANSNAATISGVLATWPIGVGTLKTR